MTGASKRIPGVRLDCPRGPSSKRMSRRYACPSTALSRMPHTTHPTPGDHCWGSTDAEPAATDRMPRVDDRIRVATATSSGHRDRHRHWIRSCALPIRHGVIQMNPSHMRTPQTVYLLAGLGCETPHPKPVRLSLGTSVSRRDTHPWQGAPRHSHDRDLPLITPV